MSHYAPFRRKRLRLRRPLVQSGQLEPGFPEPEPAAPEYSYPSQAKPKAASMLRQKAAYASLAVLAAASVVVTGLAMAPRTPPPPSGAAEAYLADREQEPAAEPAPAAVPSPLEALAGDIEAALAAPGWPESLSAGEPGPDLEAALQEAGTACNPEDPQARDCSITPGDMSRTALVVGDTAAAEWVPALRQALEPQGWRVVSLAYAGCALPGVPALPVSLEDDCAVHAGAVARAVAEAAPGLVLTSNSYPDEPVDGTAWEEGLTVLHQEWLAPAGRVLALGPAPAVPDALACRDQGSTPEECVVSADPVRAGYKAAEQAAAERAGAGFIDPLAWFCGADGRCPAFVGEAAVRQDGVLGPAYAARLSPVFAEALLSLMSV